MFVCTLMSCFNHLAHWVKFYHSVQHLVGLFCIQIPTVVKRLNDWGFVFNTTVIKCVSSQACFDVRLVVLKIDKACLLPSRH